MHRAERPLFQNVAGNPIAENQHLPLPRNHRQRNLGAGVFEGNQRRLTIDLGSERPIARYCFALSGEFRDEAPRQSRRCLGMTEGVDGFPPRQRLTAQHGFNHGRGSSRRRHGKTKKRLNPERVEN